MRISTKYFTAFRGYSCYELQIGPLWIVVPRIKFWRFTRPRMGWDHEWRDER